MCATECKLTGVLYAFCPCLIAAQVFFFVACAVFPRRVWRRPSQEHCGEKPEFVQRSSLWYKRGNFPGRSTNQSRSVRGRGPSFLSLGRGQLAAAAAAAAALKYTRKKKKAPVKS